MKRKDDCDLGCLLLILLLLALGGCFSCGFSGCGVRVSVNETEKK